MPLNSVVESKLLQSGDSLKQVSEVADLLIEDAFIRMEKPQLSPMLTVDALCGSACAITESEVRVSIGNSDGFFNITAKRAKEFVRKIVGASPGIIEDIAKAISKPIDDVIKTIQKEIDAIVKAFQGFVQGGFDWIADAIKVSFNTVGKFIGDSITFAMDKIGEGFNFITTTIDALLKGVADAFDVFTLVIQNAFKVLGDIATGLFTFELEDILSLQNTLVDATAKQQTEDLKKRAGVG